MHHAANHLIFDLAAKPAIFARSRYAAIVCLAFSACRFTVPTHPYFVVALMATYQKFAGRLDHRAFWDSRSLILECNPIPIYRSQSANGTQVLPCLADNSPLQNRTGESAG